MLIYKFIYLTSLINIAYKHKKNYIKINYFVQIKTLVKYLYKSNYVKYIKHDKLNKKIIIYINYYNNNNTNLSINFFKIKQYIHINYIYLNKLNYNYLMSISSNKKEYIVDKVLVIKYKHNGRLIALLY